jgi:hypothetical protein
MALHEQASLVAELESERAALKEQLAELSSRLESIETQGDPSSSLAQRRLELRTKELESRLDLEQTTRARMEVRCYHLSYYFSSSIISIIYWWMDEKSPVCSLFLQPFFYFLPALLFLIYFVQRMQNKIMKVIEINASPHSMPSLTLLYNMLCNAIELLFIVN